MSKKDFKTIDEQYAILVRRGLKFGNNKIPHLSFQAKRCGIFMPKNCLYNKSLIKVS